MGFFSSKPKPADVGPKTAIDIFSINLKLLPDDSCKELAPEFNSGASVVLPFERKLDINAEGKGLFDLLRINTFQDSKGKNFCFSQSRPQFNVVKFKALVEEYAVLLGKDNNGRKGLTGDDIEEIKGGYWMGRFWDKNMKSEAVSINYYDDDGVSLTIFTVES